MGKVKMPKFSGVLAAAVTAGLFAAANAAINVTVDADAGIKKISPYLYGRNIDKISDTSVESDTAETNFINKVLESGIHMMRANNGNNSTRYNWRRKMTVHPDWFNNVYAHDWDITAKKILDKMPGVDALYGFQLTGYAASSTNYNFPDWDWKQEHGSYPSRTFDLAGGGEVSDDGKTQTKAGDASLYNMKWPADSTVAIIPHWKDELKYDMSRFRYWSMDNEMEIWRGTHNDLDLPVTGDFLVERYIDVAKKARAAWGDIKLTGPVVANEWQWCHIGAYNDESRPKIDGKEYCWLEFFIKKVAEAQKSSGKRLLDVFDIHWYPTEKDYESRVNWHRVLFDTTYYYMGGNGVRCASGTCDWSEHDGKKEYRSYIFVRINQWLEKYFGKDHGIKLAITETDLNDSDPMVTALTYASFLGTMQDNGVEIFTPWTWGDGMFEVVHLFSRYGHENRVQSTSSNDSLVSAYSSISNKGDSLTVIFVNRAENNPQDVYLSLDGFKAENTANALTLSGIAGETFVSHTSNALKKNAVNVKMTGGMTNATENYANKFSMTLPAKSITAVLFTTKNPKVVDAIATTAVRPNYSLTLQGREILVSGIQQNSRYALTNTLGQVIRSGLWNGAAGATLKLSVPASGRYILQIGGKSQTIVVK